MASATTTTIIQLNAPTHFPIKLTTVNFPVWRRQIHATLVGFNLFGYADGTTKEPAKFTCPAQTSINPAHLAWYRQDQVIVSALLGSCEDYSSIISAIRIREKPLSFGELADVLTDHERQLIDADALRQSFNTTNVTQRTLSPPRRNHQSNTNRRARNNNNHYGSNRQQGEHNSSGIVFHHMAENSQYSPMDETLSISTTTTTSATHIDIENPYYLHSSDGTRTSLFGILLVCTDDDDGFKRQK
ncbi:PREDICTED: uncharacterized protein LOC109158029 [Ipomoea nil]|uniref:uncharacterized protein LOC109158029 n=1 Tax=Ipomoea nil TaxID=35883 RepID=UPI000901E27D|nr:PREDICTED: uncharacterized protein LOC109158029 [Ipomoea nil]